jgi:type I restriction enzyme R subunit
MWEDILQKETVLRLLDDFIFVEKDEKGGEKIIFPRFHQLNAVRCLAEHICEHGAGQNYLIQHSAGSGKTNTIGWLAYRLASLYDKNEKEVFKSIIIITDRIVVDRQLQEAVSALEHEDGQIKVLDENCAAKDLADALNGNTKIIVSTIQKFGFVFDRVTNLAKSNFAIIIDEAHSSTSGATMGNVNKTLGKRNDAGSYADEEEKIEEKTAFDEIEEKILQEIALRGRRHNVSMIAFTATPKASTLQLFGTPDEKGKKTAFDTYSMKQAVEEGFILDVLQNYTTYKTYYRINKAVEDDPELKTTEAKRKIAGFVNVHDTNIFQKTEIIVEHFRTTIAPLLGGKAKALVVTSSRIAAVKYKFAFDEYIKDHGYKEINTLVAFSGKVTVEMNKNGVVSSKEFAEEKMNGFSAEMLRKEFDKDKYNVLIVANKYQTGFDQPKLAAMYIDKKLHGVAAVQTLSRLNRIYRPYDKTTFILDFKNSYNDIQQAFAPYYTWTVLKKTVTVSNVLRLAARIDGYGFLDYGDIDAFNDYFYREKRDLSEEEKMEALLDKALRLAYQHSDDELKEIKSCIKNFLRLYGFLILASGFEDVELHKKYNFLSRLINEIEVTKGGNDFDIADKITVTFQKPYKSGEFDKGCLVAEPEIEYSVSGESAVPPDEQRKKLSKIIEEINAAFDKRFDADVEWEKALKIKEVLLKDEKLKASALANNFTDFHFAYDDAVETALSDHDDDEEFYSLLLDNDEVRKRVTHIFMGEIYIGLRGNSAA